MFGRPIIARFAKSQDGTILVLWAMALTVLMGLLALSFDIGRIASTQSELQSFADNVALAAAGELDGSDSSITRASMAAATMISDSQTFGNGDKALGGVADYTLTFLENLPANDLSAVTGGITTDPNDARYAHVSITPTDVTWTFGAAFATLRGETLADTSVSANAVAGFTQYACDVTPLMFCVPSPTFSADEEIGSMILLRSGGNGAAWGPGDFGFLDPTQINVDEDGKCAGKNGVQLTACLIAAEGSITACFKQDGVDIEPGQKVGIEDAIFNIRFDIYKAIMNGKRNDPDYPPAPNVISGIVPKSGMCIGNNEEVSTDTKGLPRDDCFAAGTCTRFGDGNWTNGRAEYVAWNYDGIDPYGADPSVVTRYHYYLAEIASAGGGASTADILTGKDESGRPICSSNQSSDPERRVVVAAAIDCEANAIKGAATNVPVKEFVKIFLTEPVGDDGGSPRTLDLWGEVIGTAGGGAGGGGNTGVFHDVIQLYR